MGSMHLQLDALDIGTLEDISLLWQGTCKSVLAPVNVVQHKTKVCLSITVQI